MPSDITELRRQLVSVLQQSGGDKLCGLVIGRFQKESQVAREDIEEVVAALPQLAGLAVLANIDFRHTNSQLTFPFGGNASIVSGSESSIRFKRS